MYGAFFEIAQCRKSQPRSQNQPKARTRLPASAPRSAKRPGSHSMRSASLAFLVCAVSTWIAWVIRKDLPAPDETETVRQIWLWQGFAAMAAIDAGTIAVLRLQGRYRCRLTNHLTIILAFAILAHTAGAFAYATRNYSALIMYDYAVTILTLAQIAVFGWWLGSRNGRRDRRYAPRSTRPHGAGRSVALRHKSHAAHNR